MRVNMFISITLCIIFGVMTYISFSDNADLFTIWSFIIPFKIFFDAPLSVTWPYLASALSFGLSLVYAHKIIKEIR